MRGTNPLRRLLNNVGNYFGHAQKGIVLDALGGADEQHARTKVRQHGLEDATGMMRGHHADDEVRGAQCVFETIGRGHGFGNGAPGKKEIVYVAGVDALADLHFVGPQTDLVAAAASQDDGDGGAPRPGSDDSDLAHVVPVFLPPEAVFVARQQAADVVLVTNDDQQGSGGHRAA